MTLNKAIETIKVEFEKAKNLEFVRDPLAYTLYKVWKMADEENSKKKERSEKNA